MTDRKAPKDRYLQIDSAPEHLFNIYHLVGRDDEVLDTFMFFTDVQDALGSLREEGEGATDQDEIEFYEAIHIKYAPVVGWIGESKEVPDEWN